MAKTKRRKIDWDSIPVVIQHVPEPNLRNRYATASPGERERALADVARSILLRRLRSISSN